MNRPDRYEVGVLLALAACVLAAVSLYLSACARARLAELPPAPTPWCFRVELENGDAGLGCSGRESTCRGARRDVVRFAGLLNVTAVGECGLGRPQP